MSVDMLRERARSVEDSKRRKKKDRVKKEVLYTLSGRKKKEKTSLGVKILIGILAFVLVVLGIIYIPPMFYKEEAVNGYMPITPDSSALKTYQTYLKDHPDDDFDGDGLINSVENEHGTDIWSVDTDNDGVNDYAELFITETSPIDATYILSDRMQEEDKKNGKDIRSIYKIDEIMFWPDDYTAKAYGGVVRTLLGYRFCNYQGWVRFPEKVYAYRYVDGIHYEIESRSISPKEPDIKAWRIDSSDEIVTYSEPLTFVNHLSLPFVGNLYLADDSVGNFLSKVLPDQGGIITCYKEASIDTEPDVSKDVTAPLKQPKINQSDASRLTENQNTLKDLSKVRKLIEAGECVAASFYSSSTGESIGIIYGYKADGSLLIADVNLNPVGTIKIYEKARRMMNSEGVIGQVSWFDWEGLGFSSIRYKDHINFFASTITAVEDDYFSNNGQDVFSNGERENANAGVQGNPDTEAAETEAREPVTENVLNNVERASENQIAETEATQIEIVQETDKPQVSAETEVIQEAVVLPDLNGFANSNNFS